MTKAENDMASVHLIITAAFKLNDLGHFNTQVMINDDYLVVAISLKHHRLMVLAYLGDLFSWCEWPAVGGGISTCWREVVGLLASHQQIRKDCFAIFGVMVSKARAELCHHRL